MSVCRGCSRHEHRDFVTPRPLRSCTFMHAPKPRRGFPALPDRKCERNGQCPPASILNWYKVNFIPTEQPMDSATDASSLTWYKMDIASNCQIRRICTLVPIGLGIAGVARTLQAGGARDMPHRDHIGPRDDAIVN